jgi:hypothetical protein
MQNYITVAKLLLQEICKKNKSYKLVRELSGNLSNSLKRLGELAVQHKNENLRNTIYGKGGFPKTSGLLEAIGNITKTLQVDGELASIFMVCVSFQMIEQVVEAEYQSRARDEDFILGFESLYGKNVLNDRMVVEYLGTFDTLDNITKHIVVEKSLGLITEVYHSIAVGSRGTDNADLQELVSIYTSILYDDTFNLSGSFFDLHKMIHYNEFGTKDKLIQYLGITMGVVHAISQLHDLSDEMGAFLKDLKNVGIILGTNNVTLGEVELTMEHEEGEPVGV